MMEAESIKPGRLAADRLLLQRLLHKRYTTARELTTMAQSSEVCEAMAQFHAAGKRSDHYRAVQAAIRQMEALDALLYQRGGIKKLPKPPYPGGKRV